MKPPTVLLLIILLGFSLRVFLIFFSDHIYYPDEIFQTLEIGFRLVQGFGVIPWDVAFGLRSFIPGALAILPLWPLSYLNLDQPSIYVPAVKLWLAFLSLSLIPAAYYFSLKINPKPKPAIFAAFLIAVWYELLYFSSRAFTENLALTYFAFALLALNFFPKRLYLFLFFLTVGCLLRPQYFVIYFAGLFWQRTQILRSKSLSLIAVFSAFGLFGFSDLLTYGSFLSHLGTNLRLSLFSGISQAFGTKPWFYYVTALTAASVGLHLAPLFGLKKPHLKFLALICLVLFSLHTLLPHKEYRFLFALLPLNLVIVSQLLKPKMSVYLLLSLISLLGLLHRLPFQTLAYPYPPLYQDQYLKFVSQLSAQPNLCGLYLPHRGWVYTGGFYRLGADVHLTFYPHNPPPGSYNYVLLEQPGITLQSRPGSCLPAVSPAYLSFPQIDPLLRQISARPVLKPDYGGQTL